MDTKTYSLDELCQLTDTPKRTVRYYIQLGLIDRPLGETRAAHYLSSHLEQLLKVKGLSGQHIPLEEIRQLMQGGGASTVLRQSKKPGTIEVKTHLHVLPGVELQISHEEARLSSEQIRHLLKEVLAATQKVLGERKTECG